MAAVGGVELNERGVSGDGPLVAGAQAELNRRRIGARGTDRTERVGDRRAIGTGAVAVLRDRLAEVRTLGIVVDQRRRVRLPAVVPRCRTLQRQPVDHPGHQRRLDTLDEEVLAVGIVEYVAAQTWVEE